MYLNVVSEESVIREVSIMVYTGTMKLNVMEHLRAGKSREGYHIWDLRARDGSNY